MSYFSESAVFALIQNKRTFSRRISPLCFSCATQHRLPRITAVRCAVTIPRTLTDINQGGAKTTANSIEAWTMSIKTSHLYLGLIFRSNYVCLRENGRCGEYEWLRDDVSEARVAFANLISISGPKYQAKYQRRCGIQMVKIIFMLVE